jgi:dihydropteroate synthase
MLKRMDKEQNTEKGIKISVSRKEIYGTTQNKMV